MRISKLRKFFKFSFTKYRKELQIRKYREHDNYGVDIITKEAGNFTIEPLLPSEPPYPLTYSFGPTGYLTKNKNQDYCSIITPWRNPNNYCHWTFCEVPLIHLALASEAKNIILPKELYHPQMPFQRRWIEILLEKFSEKNILLKEENPIRNPIIPINHDTLRAKSKIGKCLSFHYNQSRPSPYLIDVIESIKPYFLKNLRNTPKKIYIKRKKRMILNEPELEHVLQDKGFESVWLEELSLDDQFQYFNNATHIIGFHGAGLSNIIFCKQRTSVWEIADRDCVYPSYLDNVIIPGRKAPRVYYHLTSHIMKLEYKVLLSNNYLLDISQIEGI
ncbi:MAG: glycosyltransferase family 61 protein [Marinoscillum sp.]